METRSEIVKKFKKLRKEMNDHQDVACRFGEEMKDIERVVDEQIIEHWLKHGGLDGKYFKSPSYDQWVYIDEPTNRGMRYTHYMYIKHLINVTKGHVTFYGQEFPLPPEGKYAEYSSIGVDLQTTIVSALHPEYEITQTEFETAVVEWEKRSKEFVESIIKDHKKGKMSSINGYGEE